MQLTLLLATKKSIIQFQAICITITPWTSTPRHKPWVVWDFHTTKKPLCNALLGICAMPSRMTTFAQGIKSVRLNLDSPDMAVLQLSLPYRANWRWL